MNISEQAGSYRWVTWLPTACANQHLSYFSPTLRDRSEQWVVDAHKGWKSLKRPLILQLFMMMWETATEKSTESEGLSGHLATAAGCTICTYFQKAVRLHLACLLHSPSAASREEERHHPKGVMARETLCFQTPHRQMVRDGREGKGTDLYLILALLSWQSMRQKNEMVWKWKEKETIDMLREVGQVERGLSGKASKAAKGEIKQGSIKMLLPNPGRQVRSLATLIQHSGSGMLC